MQRKRILALIVVFLIFDAILAILYLQSKQRSADVVVIPQSADSSPITTAEPTTVRQNVFFVPVTSFSNFILKDLNEVSGKVYVQSEYVEAIGGLDMWAHVVATPALAEDTFFDALNIELGTSVALIPLAELTPAYRVLMVDGVSVFDETTPWPLTLNIESGHIEDVVPGDVREMIFGGTVVLSRGVAERIIKYSDTLYPWSEISGLLTNADYTFVNFKGAITSDCEYDGYTLRFCGTPAYLKGMADAGVSGVSVSGNHIGDYGQKGLRETVEYLDEFDIEHTGLGVTSQNASKPVIVTFGEGETKTTVGILAYNNVYGTAPCADTTEQWAVTCLLDENVVAAEIKALDAQVDIVVIYPNWGPEYTHTPHGELQVKWGRLFVDAGADIVLGDQAHWVQTMEFYKDVPIYYGLGNFVFDQMWSDKTREGLLVQAYVHGGRILSTDPIPTRIYDYAQVRIEEGSIGDVILSYLTLPVQ